MYEIEVYDANGCFGIAYLDYESNSISDLQIGFKIYPNPATDHIFIETENAIEDLHVIDLSGRSWIVKQGLIGNQIISLEGLIDGVYVLRIKTQSGTVQSKLVIRN